MPTQIISRVGPRPRPPCAPSAGAHVYIYIFYKSERANKVNAFIRHVLLFIAKDLILLVIQYCDYYVNTFDSHCVKEYLVL